MRSAKKFFAAALLLIVVFNSISFSRAYDLVGLSNFEKDGSYVGNTFSDIEEQDWYYENVKSVYEYGLMNGKGDNKFDPLASISIAETITLSSRIHYMYFNGSTLGFDSTDIGDVWYEPYVDYAEEVGIAYFYSDYTAPATRSEFAAIVARSIDPVDLQEINWIDDGAIPDVSMDMEAADAIYLLYRAGILTGNDAQGAFAPSSTITRAEAAAIITRIVDPSLRKNIELSGEY